MTDIREMTAKEIRAAMEQTAFLIDGYHEEYAELEDELERRGLKTSIRMYQDGIQ